MRRVGLASAACLVALTLTACDAFTRSSAAPLEPLPAHVPAGPRFTAAEEITARLARNGMNCEVFLERGGAGSGKSLHCLLDDRGTEVEAQITVFDTTVVKEGEIGLAVRSRRTPPRGQTLVVAANWYIRVLPADALAPARRMADALGGVVLPPLHPLPAIPDGPQHADANALAAALDGSVGCTRRKASSPGELRCRTNTSAPAPDCASPFGGRDAHLAVHRTPTERDDYLRLLLTEPRAPRHVVTAGNWSLQLCTADAARTAARDLGGVVVPVPGR
ncbi:hypothetical protein [Streptomyces sp. NPDC005805]|uniref:hypothetical protein n=1 Tax=Streptomyces sp. NPDC005805 TaxID=3157068 RepID=UPI00340AE041